MKHAVFKHDSHRMLDCAQCHPPAAGKASARPAADRELPGIKTCLGCHDAHGRRARSDCVECHLYHDPARRANFRGGLTIEEATRR
jgi:hypothetical protein